ncbi:hypothetical protein ACFJIV_01995 [Mucilaginibacter sp. UC70_90]
MKHRQVQFREQDGKLQSLKTRPVTTYTYTVKTTEWMVDGTNIPAGL